MSRTLPFVYLRQTAFRMTVCILGCGPAGLLSAYAAEQRGWDVVILSRKVKSPIPGAVFLHEPIPGLTAPTPDGVVKFVKHGNKEGYAAKVYGYMDADCSWDLFPEGERPAWSMFSLYDQLWERFHDRIADVMISTIQMVQILCGGFDVVISTIPAPFLCYNDKHTFDSRAIHVLNKTVDPSLDNAIVYNGGWDDMWYRTSKLFGAEATESTSPFDSEIIEQLGARPSNGYKPLTTDCNCYPNVARVGRFGRWEKGILVHHSYKQTVQVLEEWM